MRTIGIFLFVAALFGLTACQGEPAPQETSSTTTPSPVELPPSHNCQLTGKILDENQIWIKELERLVCIKADSTTHDARYGDSHRILEIYDTRNCKRLFRIELPVSGSPDFPYRLTPESYDKNRSLIGLYGFQSVYYFELNTQQLSSELKPAYFTSREKMDAQSGMIEQLLFWKYMLIGHARDQGIFIFDLQDPQNPVALPAFAEYRVAGEGYTSFFLLSVAEGQYQAVSPLYDATSGKISVIPLFNRPLSVNTNIPKSARNNRYLVLRQTNETRTPIAFDLLEGQQISLPAEIAGKKTQEILEWIKQDK